MRRRRSLPVRFLRDLRKAYGKARSWDCAPLPSFVAGLRFALFGESGRFRSHGGWRVSRIYRVD